MNLDEMSVRAHVLVILLPSAGYHFAIVTASLQFILFLNSNEVNRNK